MGQSGGRRRRYIIERFARVGGTIVTGGGRGRLIAGFGGRCRAVVVGLGGPSRLGLSFGLGFLPLLFAVTLPIPTIDGLRGVAEEQVLFRHGDMDQLILDAGTQPFVVHLLEDIIEKVELRGDAGEGNIVSDNLLSIFYLKVLQLFFGISDRVDQTKVLVELFNETQPITLLRWIFILQLRVKDP